VRCQSRRCRKQAEGILFYREVQGGERKYHFCQEHIQTRLAAQKAGHERHGRPGPWWLPSPEQRN
jgi:hypothetical protein